MRLERATAYALLALVFMARQRGSAPAQVLEIATATGAPVEYLRKLMGRLSRARLITSVRGRHGGFRLAMPVNQVTMLRIVEAIEGPIDAGAVIEDDLLHAGANNSARPLSRWRKTAADSFRKLLSETTLADVVPA